MRGRKKKVSMFAGKKKELLAKKEQLSDSLQSLRRKSRKTLKSYLLHPLNRRQKKNLIIVVVFLIAMIAVAQVTAEPLTKFLTDPSEFQQFAKTNPLLAGIVFMGIMMLQIVIAVIPGEPVQLAAGYAFGSLWGTLLALGGSILGSIVVFLLVKRYGRVLVELFFSEDQLKKISFIHDSKRLNTLVFILMFIPGTPKDLITYIVGLTPMKLITWLLISTPARTPALLASTVAGANFGNGNTRLTMLILVITGILAVLGIIYYAFLTKQAHNKKHMDKMQASYKKNKESRDDSSHAAHDYFEELRKEREKLEEKLRARMSKNPHGSPSSSVDKS